jgi:hypothetical protein
VNLPTLIVLSGSAWIMVVVGAILIALGVAVAILPIPLWVCLCALGLVAVIAGFAVVQRARVEPKRQVEKLLHNPWLTLGASISCGLFLARLTRSRRSRDAGASAVGPPGEAASTPTEDGGTGISHYLGQQLRSVGSLASTAALSLAMEVLGVPSMQEMID